MKELIIFGAGELAKEIVWLIEEINKIKPQYLIRGFIDNKESSIGSYFNGYKILGNEEWLINHYNNSETSAIIAVQDPKIRKQIYERNSFIGDWETLIHPSSVISSTVKLGKGNVVFPFVSISVDTVIGDFCLCYLHSAVSNDCKIGNYVSMMSGVQISQHVTIGDQCSLGARCCIYPNVQIGKNVGVSSGAVVEKNCNDNDVIHGKNGFHFFK